MAQNMNVSVTLQLRDQFTQPVRALMQQLQGLTRAAQEFNRAAGGTGSSSGFGRLQQQVRSLGSDVRQLANQFSQLGRSMATPTGGSFASRQVADMRTLLGLQQQALANQRALGAGGSGRVTNLPGCGGILGRRGFSPNASLADRAQYRAVNVGERSLVEGALELNQARTQLLMLAMPRRDPANPGNLLPGVITDDVVNRIEAEAAGLTNTFRALNRAQVMDTFRELVTQFADANDAFKLLPSLLNVQSWQVLQGDTVQRAREGMLSLVRAIGLSGRLVNNDGRLKMVDENGQEIVEAERFLDYYLRARMVGGRDVTPEQTFQVLKYLKTTGQTMSLDALLTAFIGMPDIRGSTFGNQINQLRKSLLGSTTQAAQLAMQAGGLGTIGDRTQSGGHVFNPVDPVLLNENIFEWFDWYILAPGGYLQRQGINPLSASAAQISTAFRRIMPNQSAESIANSIVNQQAEWRTQIANARRWNNTPEARRTIENQDSWHAFARVRAGLTDVLGSVAENFKVLTPILDSIGDGFKTLARWIDPRIGSPVASLAVLGGGAAGGLWALRGMAARMGPMQRMLLGGGAGFLLGGGDITSALMGGLMGRQMGSMGAGTGGAGAAGAAAGRQWGGRFMTAAMWALRGLRSIVFRSAAGWAIGEIVTNWETVKPRLLAIFAELKAAAPAWAGGGGQGTAAFSSGQGFAQLGRDVHNKLVELGITNPDHYTPHIRTPLNDEFRQQSRPWWHLPTPWAVAGDAWRWAWGTGTPSATTAPAQIPGGNTVTTGPINVTVNVQTNADPNTIGEAAGNALGSALRGVMNDLPPLP